METTVGMNAASVKYKTCRRAIDPIPIRSSARIGTAEAGVCADIFLFSGVIRHALIYLTILSASRYASFVKRYPTSSAIEADNLS